jgi:hypothetical protein
MGATDSKVVKEGEVHYELLITTGAKKHAGTDSDVYITVNGTQVRIRNNSKYIEEDDDEDCRSK